MYEILKDKVKRDFKDLDSDKVKTAGPGSGQNGTEYPRGPIGRQACLEVFAYNPVKLGKAEDSYIYTEITVVHYIIKVGVFASNIATPNVVVIYSTVYHLMYIKGWTPTRFNQYISRYLVYFSIPTTTQWLNNESM